MSSHKRFDSEGEGGSEIVKEKKREKKERSEEEEAARKEKKEKKKKREAEENSAEDSKKKEKKKDKAADDEAEERHKERKKKDKRRDEEESQPREERHHHDRPEKKEYGDRRRDEGGRSDDTRGGSNWNDNRGGNSWNDNRGGGGGGQWKRDREMRQDRGGDWNRNDNRNNFRRNDRKREDPRDNDPSKPAWATGAVMDRANELKKRQLLWKKPAEGEEASSSAGVEPKVEKNAGMWSAALTAAAGGNTAQSSKFMKLMGIKSAPTAEGGEGVDAKQVKEEAAKQKALMAGLERQYEVSREFSHQGRGKGLGFGGY